MKVMCRELQARLRSTQSELTQLPNVKATILDFQKTAEITHAQLIDSRSKLSSSEREQKAVQEELAREKRNLQSLRAELAVALREIEARQTETKLARDHSKGIEASLDAANKRAETLQAQLELSENTVRNNVEERAAVASAGEELERILTQLSSGQIVLHTGTYNTSSGALAGVHRGCARLQQDWKEMQNQISVAETEQETIFKGTCGCARSAGRKHKVKCTTDRRVEICTTRRVGTAAGILAENLPAH